VSNNRPKDLELWEEWKHKRSKRALNGLMKEMTPVLESFKNSHYTTNMQIPPGAFDGVIKGLAYSAFKTYDPSKGVKLSTHVYNHLQKSKRFVATYQNIGRIPENRIFDVGKFNRAYTTMEEKLGRPPESKELAKHLRWTVKEVDLMSRSLRRDVAGSKFESDPTENIKRSYKLLDAAAKSSLDAFDYKLYELSKKGLKGKELAKRLHTSPAKVTRRKQHIYRVLSKYQGLVER
jgi:DNA-directed RNA polymerase sigma subunit (sigma70/sigma32)